MFPLVKLLSSIIKSKFFLIVGYAGKCWINLIFEFHPLNCMRVNCVAYKCVCWSGGACVALCLVLTHPAINCVSTAAVCIGQIESSATGPFCFSPLG